jgi:hypothetical protein
MAGMLKNTCVNLRPRLMRAVLAALLLASAGGGVAAAATLQFGPDLTGSGWTVVEYPGIRPATFRGRDPVTLDVVTDASAGLLWRPVERPLHTARKASWRWHVDEGVKPTDLTHRGADDRILGLYFIFGLERDIGATPIRMLSSSSVFALTYVFGSGQPRGAIIASPHMGERGKFVVLRNGDAAKGTWHSEAVNLGDDYARAFERRTSLLIGIAVSSDSDDTRGRNWATISNLTLDQ